MNDRLRFERTYWRKGVTLVAGVDESGRGPLAGPVLAAAVIFPVGFWLEDIDDSKKLSESERERLFPLILERAVSVGLSVIDHEVIDRMNIYQASILAMQNAVAQLHPVPHVVLADGNSFTHQALRYRNIIKGDARSMTIAAASIIAKVTRDRIMAEIDGRYPQYGFARHKGYATPQHLEAIALHGFCDIHRKSFHPRSVGDSAERPQQAELWNE